MCWVIVAVSSDQRSVLELSKGELSCWWIFLEIGKDWVGSHSSRNFS